MTKAKRRDGCGVVAGRREVPKHDFLCGAPTRVVGEGAPHDQTDLTARGQRSIRVAKCAHGALEEHHAKARVDHVEMGLAKVAYLRVTHFVPHVIRVGLITLPIGDVEKRIGAIDSEHFTARPHHLADLQRGLTEPAPDIENLVPFLDVEVRPRDVAVDLPVPREQVSKSNPLGREDLVPAFDEPEVVGGDVGHVADGTTSRTREGPRLLSSGVVALVASRVCFVTPTRPDAPSARLVGPAPPPPTLSPTPP